MNKNKIFENLKKLLKKSNKKKYIALLVVLLIAVISWIIVTFKMQPMETEIHLEVLTKQITYFENATPVDPMNLVQITRDKQSKKTEKPFIEEGLKVSCYPEVIDTSKIGTIEVWFTVVDENNHDSTQKVSAEFEVIDENAPKFELKSKSITIQVDDKFDPSSFVKNSSGAELVETQPEAKSDGTYDVAWYTITSNVNSKKAGSYSVKYHVVGKNGTSADFELKVKVKDKKTTEKDAPNEKSKSSTTNTTNPKKVTDSSTSTNISKSNNTPANNNSSAQVTGGDSYNGKEQPVGCTVTKVHHDAITKETSYQVWVEDQPETIETYLQCSCGSRFNTQEEVMAHIDSMEQQEDYGHTYSVVTNTIPATGHYETKTSTEIITPAYDEDVCK